MSTAFPLSPLQEWRWQALQAEPRFPWSASLTIAVRGPLDPVGLRLALDRLVERHEIQRARVLVEHLGAPPQLASERRGQASLELLDWSSATMPERARECRRIELALRTLYPLDGAAPLRAALARVAPEEHVLVLAQSALAADWRSLWNLAKELLRGSGTARADEGEAPVQFADLALWLRNALDGPDAEAGREHWRALGLADVPELRLPLEYDRGPRPRELHEVSRELPAAIQDTLLELARRRGLPVASLLAAVWHAWLARLAEREELVVGVRSSGRAFEGLAEALGPFERALPVRARVDERVSLLELARTVDEAIARGEEWHEFFQPHVAAEAHANYAFEFLPRVEPEVSGALRLEVLRRDGFGEPARGLLRVEHGEGGMELRFAVDARWLGRADAEALAGPFVTLLESALSRPDSPLASLPACDGERRAELLALARGPALEAETRTLPAWIEEVARKHPAATAVAAEDGELGYAALDQRSLALALELESLGVGPGSLVGVHLERSTELVVALLAVLRAGGAYVPLPPGYPRERVLAMLADSRASVVVGSESSRAALAGFRGTIVPASAVRPTPSRRPAAVPAGADLAYVIYTSGSSGKPKGVPITHANLAHSTRARLAHYPERVERYLLLSSFAFDSSVAGIFWTLAQGGTLVLPPEGLERDLADLPSLIARRRPSHLLALPSLWSLVLEQARPGELDSLTTVIVAGESCPAELVRRHAASLPRARLHNEYGPTEGTVWSTVFDASRPFERAQVPIGRPIPGSSNYVLTPERDLAPIGVAGELWIGGPGVARGYLERPELTAERFADDPFSGGRMYRTGDRARLLPDGNLEFLGRTDHQVKIRGYRIELEEIEAVLDSHPAVRESVVLARNDDGRGPCLVAYVLPIGPRPAGADLLRYLGERLPEYMRPAQALCLDRWPLLPNGKVDRAALPAPEPEGGFEEPCGALEIVLAALWADVLGIEAVGRHDDFFALGGHSLSATRLYARLKETLQLRLPLRALFEQRTPAALASELARDPAEGARVARLAEIVLAVLQAEEGEHALEA